LKNLGLLYIQKNALNAFIIVNKSLPVVNWNYNAMQYLFLAFIHTTYFLNVSV